MYSLNRPAEQGEKDQAQTAYHEAGHAVLALELGHRLEKATIVPSEWALGFIEHGLAEDQTNYEGESGLMDAMEDIVGSMVIEQALNQAEQNFDAEEVRHWVQLPRQAIRSIQAVLGSPPLARAVGAKLTELLYESIVMVAMAGQAAECVREGREEPDWTRGSSQDHEDILGTLADLIMLDPVAADVDGVRESPYSSEAYFEYVWVRTLMMVRQRWSLVEAVATELLTRQTLSGPEVQKVVSRERQAKRV